MDTRGSLFGSTISRPDRRYKRFAEKRAKTMLNCVGLSRPGLTQDIKMDNCVTFNINC